MATINIDDVLEVVMTWDTPLASVAQNVWHYIMVSGAGADSADILTEIETQMQVAFAAIEDFINDEFHAVFFELRKWDFTLHRFDGVGTLATTDLNGQSVVDYEPHGVAALGRIITENARRQGGTYVPGLSHDNVENGVLSAAAEAGMLLYLAAFDGDVVVVGAVLSWCTFNVEPTSPVYETASIAAQTVIANSLPSYLSKRKPGTGL